jgi:dienelactone hydrolase
MIRRSLLLVTLVASACATGRPGVDPPPPAEIAPFFQVPEAYRQDMGPFRSPLLFNDGRRVESVADWTRRRAEILATWTAAMGAWPPLIDAPKVEIVETTRRDGITQQQLTLGVALEGEPTTGFLLVPPGAGPFPAVLVLFYEAQSGVGLGSEKLDWAWQLARRGFVALSIGKPTAPFLPGEAQKARGASYFGPAGKPLRVQPLSALAYLAANAHTVLARRPDVRADRIGIIGHSFGGKWALFASALYEKFACAVWSDPGIVFDERDRAKQNPRGAVNYWANAYLGSELGQLPDLARVDPYFALPRQGRTGAYKTLVDGGHDLVELHALLAPRPFLVSGGSADLPERWPALRHAIDVNRRLGVENRVAMTNREGHSPTDESNAQACRFFEWWLRDR